MDPAGEEGTAIGQLRRGLRSVAGVVSDEVYASLCALQAGRGVPTMSRTVGAALEEWHRLREPGPGLQPRAKAYEASEASTAAEGPESPRDVALEPWQEVRGTVRDVSGREGSTLVLLEDATGLFALVLPPGSVGADLLISGARVAVLRTDGTVGDHRIRLIEGP